MGDAPAPETGVSVKVRLGRHEWGINNTAQLFRDVTADYRNQITNLTADRETGFEPVNPVCTSSRILF